MEKQQVYERDGGLYLQAGGDTIKLEPETIQAVYRFQEKEFAIDDAMNQAVFLAEDTFPDFTQQDFRDMAEEFLNSDDCNVAENDRWMNIVTRKEAEVQKREKEPVEMSTDDLCDEIGDAAWDNDWGVDWHDNSVTFSNHSPAGQDISFDIDFNSAADLQKQIVDYAESFDPEENVELWIEYRGKDGVPERVSEIVEDSEAIKRMFDVLAEAVKKVDVRGEILPGIKDAIDIAEDSRADGGSSREVKTPNKDEQAI